MAKDGLPVPTYHEPFSAHYFPNEMHNDPAFDFDVCLCEHERGEHDGGSGRCEAESDVHFNTRCICPGVEMAATSAMETRTFTRPASGPLHIVRHNPPETASGYLKYARPGSRWTYCGLDCEAWPSTEPETTPDDPICRRCDVAYFADEDAE